VEHLTKSEAGKKPKRFGGPQPRQPRLSHCFGWLYTVNGCGEFFAFKFIVRLAFVKEEGTRDSME